MTTSDKLQNLTIEQAEKLSAADAILKDKNSTFKQKNKAIKLIRSFGVKIDDKIEADVKEQLVWCNVPKDKRTYNFCLKHIRVNPMLLSDVPIWHLDEVMLNTAISKNPKILGLIPQNWITPEIAVISVQKFGWGLFWLPNHLKTVQVCPMAYDNSPDVYDLIPVDIRKFIFKY